MVGVYLSFVYQLRALEKKVGARQKGSIAEEINRLFFFKKCATIFVLQVAGS
jgi:hypothetical protein